MEEPKDYKYKDGSSRATKGKELLAKGAKVSAKKKGSTTVFSVEYGGKVHKVINNGGFWSCDCEDQRSRAKGGCKHIWAAYWAVKGGAVKDGMASTPSEPKEPKVEKVKKKKSRLSRVS